MNSFLSTSSGRGGSWLVTPSKTFRLKIYPFKTRDREPPLERTKYFRLSLYFRHRRAFNDSREAFQPFEKRAKKTSCDIQTRFVEERSSFKKEETKVYRIGESELCRRVKYTQRMTIMCPIVSWKCYIHDKILSALKFSRSFASSMIFAISRSQETMPRNNLEKQSMTDRSTDDPPRILVADRETDGQSSFITKKYIYGCRFDGKRGAYCARVVAPEITYSCVVRSEKKSEILAPASTMAAASHSSKKEHAREEVVRARSIDPPS